MPVSSKRRQGRAVEVRIYQCCRGRCRKYMERSELLSVGAEVMKGIRGDESEWEGGVGRG